MSGRVAAGIAPLCRLEDVADGGAKGFIVPGVGETGDLFVVRQGDRIHAYVNSCPHIGTPLEFIDDKFLNRERTLILCSTHGALFRIEDGACIDGPCEGDRLEPLAVEVREGLVYLRNGAGQSAARKLR